MLAIVGGSLWTMAGERLENTDLLVEAGKIAAIGKGLDVSLADRVIDASGMIVMPGMIDAHCHVGMREYGVGFEGADGNEMVTPVTADLHAVDGINPMNSIFQDSYEAGITTICTGPGSANVVGGQFCLMKTYGQRVDDMIIRHPYALKIAFGENPKRCYGRMLHKAPYTRMGSVSMLREWFYKAREYMRKKQEAGDNCAERPDYDAKLEAFEKVLRREIPLKAHAHRADDMFSAIRIAREFDVDLTLEHCTEGKLIAEDLKKEGYPLILGPVMCERYKVEMMGIAYDTPAVLSAAGIRFAFCTDAPVVVQRALPMIAGYSVSWGLKEEEALLSITRYPAEILGIADRVGTLETGKDADIVLYDGHPFDLEARVRLVLVDGNIAMDRIAEGSN